MRFDEMLDPNRIRHRLVRATGCGVKVGIIDSGVASDLPELEGKVVSNHVVVEDRSRNATVVNLDKGEDVLGHGTACAYIVHRLAPMAELHSVRVIGRGHNSTSQKLLAALKFAVDQNWDVLNLSLGTETNYESISRLADEAYYKGMLWIAAKDNKRMKAGYPASLSSVVGVDMEYFEDPLRFHFDARSETEVEASGVYIDAPGLEGDWQKFTGTSFACPQIAGLAARLRESFPGLTPFQFKTALHCLRENIPQSRSSEKRMPQSEWS